LTQLLQSAIKPVGVPETTNFAESNSVDYSTVNRQTPFNTNYCNLKQTYWNPGDNLESKRTISGEFSFTKKVTFSYRELTLDEIARYREDGIPIPTTEEVEVTGPVSIYARQPLESDDIYDRLVNDLNVPKGSFKVTDLIVIIKQIKSPSGLHRDRRVTQVTEVLKEWNDEPVFQDLLVYDPKTDALKATDILLKGKSVLINEIISKTRGYRNYDAALRDIFLRGWAKNEYLRLIGDNDSRLEAEYTSKANMVFTALFEEINPLEKADNIEKFQSEFTKRVSALLQQQQGG